MLHANVRVDLTSAKSRALERSSPSARNTCGLRQTLHTNGEDRALGFVIGTGLANLDVLLAGVRRNGDCTNATWLVELLDIRHPRSIEAAERLVELSPNSNV